MTSENSNRALTVLEDRFKTVEALLLKIGTNQDAIEHALKLIKKAREYSIDYFSPEMNFEIFRRIIKFRNNPRAMSLVADLYKLQCIEAYYTQLEENAELGDEMKKRLLFLFSKQLLGLSYENGKISSFVIGQKRYGLEGLFDMETSMQIKVNSLRFKMEKEQARYENLLAKMEYDNKF